MGEIKVKIGLEKIKNLANQDKDILCVFLFGVMLKKRLIHLLI